MASDIHEAMRQDRMLWEWTEKHVTTAGVRLQMLAFGDELEREMARKLLIAGIPNLTRDYSNDRPVPYHMIDQPPLEGERRMVFNDDYPGDVYGWFDEAPATPENILGVIPVFDDSRAWGDL